LTRHRCVEVLQDVTCAVFREFIEGLVGGCELSDASVSRPRKDCGAGRRLSPQEKGIQLVFTQSEVGCWHGLLGSRQSDTVRSQSAVKNRWVLFDGRYYSSVVLENLAASVVGSQVKRCYTILV